MSNNTVDWEGADMEMEGPTVTLTDESGRSLTCFVELTLELNDQEYALLHPVDYPVEIFAWVDDEDGDQTLVGVEDEDLDRIFETAKAVLAEQNLKLKNTALSLTVEGELPEIEEEEVITLEIEDGTSIAPEDYQPLSTGFFHEDREYAIYTPLNPMLFVARMKDEQHPELLSPEEFREIQPIIEQQLEERLFDEME